MRQSYAQRWVPRGTGSRAQAATAQVQVLGSRGLTAASAASQSGSDAGAATSSVLGRAAQTRARGPACRRHRRPALGHREAGHSLLAVLHLFLSVMSPPSHASRCSRLACSSEGAGRLEPLGRRARPSARRGQPPRPCHPVGSGRRALGTERADWRCRTTGSEPGPGTEACPRLSSAGGPRGSASHCGDMREVPGLSPARRLV